MLNIEITFAMKLKFTLLSALFSFVSLAQIQHSVSVTGGFAYTGSGDMWGTAVEGAYSYYFGDWSVTGQIGRADFFRSGSGAVAEPGLGVVDFVPAERFTAYRTADLLAGYTVPFAENRLHLIVRGGASLARIGTYYIDPVWQNNDYDVLDLGAVGEIGLGFTIISSGTATIDINIKAQGRHYFNTDDGYVRPSIGITCRLYN